MEETKSLDRRSNHFCFAGQVVLSNDPLLALCEKYLVVQCKVFRDLLDFHPFSFVPFIRMTVDFVLHYLFQPENQVLLFDSFVVQSLNLVKGIALCTEYRPGKIIEGIFHIFRLKFNYDLIFNWLSFQIPRACHS